MSSGLWLPFPIGIAQMVVQTTKDLFPIHRDPRARKPTELNEFYFVIDDIAEITASGSGIVIARELNEDPRLESKLTHNQLHQTNVVTIKHIDGTVARYQHVYARELQQGQKIEQGERIGILGGWGSRYGPHLHLEIYNDESFKEQWKGRLDLPK